MFLSQLVTLLLEKQDRKVSIKLRIYFYVKRVLDGPGNFWAATKSIVYSK